MNPFHRLESVQLVELAVRLNAPLPPDTPTQIGLGLSLGRARNSANQRDVLVVTIELKADAGKTKDSGVPILVAHCRLTGVWATPADEPQPVDVAAWDSCAKQHAFPVLYPLARQHLSDVLGKVGAINAKWPWDIRALEEPLAVVSHNVRHRAAKSKKSAKGEGARKSSRRSPR
jgi:hypothetical protein